MSPDLRIYPSQKSAAKEENRRATTTKTRKVNTTESVLASYRSTPTIKREDELRSLPVRLTTQVDRPLRPRLKEESRYGPFWGAASGCTQRSCSSRVSHSA